MLKPGYLKNESGNLTVINIPLAEDVTFEFNEAVTCPDGTATPAFYEMTVIFASGMWRYYLTVEQYKAFTRQTGLGPILAGI